MPGTTKKPNPNQHIHLLFLETFIEMITDSLTHPTPHLGATEPEELLEIQADVKICSASRGFHPGSALGKPVHSIAGRLNLFFQSYLSSNKAEESPGKWVGGEIKSSNPSRQTPNQWHLFSLVAFLCNILKP